MLGQPVYFLTPDVVAAFDRGALARGASPPTGPRADRPRQILAARRKFVGAKFRRISLGPSAKAFCRSLTRAQRIAKHGAGTGNTLLGHHGLFSPFDGGCRGITCAPPVAGARNCKLYENYYRAQGLWGIPQKKETGELFPRRTSKSDLAKAWFQCRRTENARGRNRN